MTTVVDGDARVLEDLARRGPRPAGPEPLWLAKVRSEAASWIETHGFPTRKDEDWRYLRLDPLLEVPFELATRDQGILRTDAIEALSLGLGGVRLAFVNGHFAPLLSYDSPGLPEHATATSLASAIAVGARRLRPSQVRRPHEHRHAFSALNAAFATDGALVELPPGTALEEPLELVFLADTGPRPLLTSPRSVLTFGAGSRATVVETYAGTPGVCSCTNAVTEIVLEEGAEVEHYRVQDEPVEAFHLSSLEVRLGKGSRFSSHLVALGSSIARHEIRVLLEGEGAEVGLDGLYLPRGTQHHDHPVLVEHAAPGCTSRQRYVGIVDDHGRGVFDGHVVVRPGADGTDAGQSSKNLLLSDHAEVDARPRLEIFADDVACAHGAAVGRLDADALFYLRSRGIAEEHARGLLTYGFARQMLDRLGLEAVRERVEELVARGLAPFEAPR